MHSEASPHENTTVIVSPVSRGVDSICRLKRVVDTVDWVNLAGMACKRKEKKGKSKGEICFYDHSSTSQLRIF